MFSLSGNKAINCFLALSDVPTSSASQIVSGVKPNLASQRNFFTRGVLLPSFPNHMFPLAISRFIRSSLYIQHRPLGGLCFTPVGEIIV